MFSTYLQLAIDSLKRQKSRTILTMLAISIGIAAVIVIMAAGKGVEKLIMGQIDLYSADTIHIEARPPQGGSGGGEVGITITTLKEKDLESILRHPNISAVSGIVMGQEAVSAEGQIKKVLLMGNSYSMPELERSTLSSGRFFTQDEEDSLATVAVLGFAANEKLFGDEDAVGRTIYIRGKPFRIVGVFNKRGSAFFLDMDNLIVLPTKTMQKKLLGIDYVSSINAKMKDITKADITKRDLFEVLQENHNISDPSRNDFEINTMAEAMELVGQVANGITMLLISLVCISLVVGGVGIMNIMYVSVAERTFEIGLRKSLGAKKKDVLWQFLFEAILVTVGGGIIGVVIGVAIAFLVYLLATSYGFKWVYSVSFFSIILSVGFSACWYLIKPCHCLVAKLHDKVDVRPVKRNDK
jgi:ABC-type antimicrobial peptide transport system permease subunit